MCYQDMNKINPLEKLSLFESLVEENLQVDLNKTVSKSNIHFLKKSLEGKATKIIKFKISSSS